MALIAKNALVYKNTAGVKIRRKAGSVFDDATATDAERFIARGFAREATIGEKAEAVAAGTFSPDALPTADGDEADDSAKAPKTSARRKSAATLA